HEEVERVARRDDVDAADAAHTVDERLEHGRQRGIDRGCGSGGAVELPRDPALAFGPCELTGALESDAAGACARCFQHQLAASLLELRVVRGAGCAADPRLDRLDADLTGLLYGLERDGECAARAQLERLCVLGL